MIKKFLYDLGILFFNPKIKEHYAFLKETEKWSYQQLLEYQKEKMIELVRLAYNNSSFYKKHYDDCNVNIDDLKTIEDLNKFPIITKEDLIKYNDEIHIQSNENLIKAKTSGTSGQSLSFLRNKTWDARNRASIHRGYSWYGVEPWNRNGYLWGFNFDFKDKIKTRILDFLQNRFRLFSLKITDTDNFLRKLQNAIYISGYSSVIYGLAKNANKSKLVQTPIKLKMIKGTSEKIFESYQQEIKEAFGTKMISEYGSAETGIIAFECPNGNQHVFMENVIIENDENVGIIVTNLVSHSFPIIRYRLGDYVSFENKESNCSCGMKHHCITEIMGRIGKAIQGHEEKYPSLTLYYIFKNLSSRNVKLNYLAIQEEKGKIQIFVEQKLSSENRAKLLKECKKYYNNDVNVVLTDNYKIESKGKKKRDFISYI